MATTNFLPMEELQKRHKEQDDALIVLYLCEENFARDRLNSEIIQAVLAKKTLYLRRLVLKYL